MTVADKHLCEELYKLSGWKGIYGPFTDVTYDLEYLFQKLPNHISGNLTIKADGTPNNEWCAYYDARLVTLTSHYQATATNALCRLAIQLFKEGILK